MPDRASAEDVLHQVFLKLLSGRVVIPETPLHYLCRAVRNTAFNDLRRRRREVALPSEASWLESPPGLEDDALALESALRSLPEEQREVVILRIWAQMTFEEAAAVVGVSTNTAASRFRYGLEKLRARLQPLVKG